jgi:hypothetical protein
MAQEKQMLKMILTEADKDGKDGKDGIEVDLKIQGNPIHLATMVASTLMSDCEKLKLIIDMAYAMIYAEGDDESLRELGIDSIEKDIEREIKSWN